MVNTTGVGEPAIPNNQFTGARQYNRYLGYFNPYDYGNPDDTLPYNNTSAGWVQVNRDSNNEQFLNASYVVSLPFKSSVAFNINSIRIKKDGVVQVENGEIGSVSSFTEFNLVQIWVQDKEMFVRIEYGGVLGTTNLYTVELVGYQGVVLDSISALIGVQAY
jgi:hypothetical protein